MAAFRIPKGVKLDGKGIGGRFLALQDLPGLAASVDAKSRAKLTKKLGSVSRAATKKLERAAAAESRAEERGRGLLQRRGARKVAQERARALRAIEDATRAATKRQREQEEEEQLDQESAAVEITIGATYLPERHGARTSAVDISILVRRIDGAKMKFSEAKRALAYVRQHRIVPADYYLAAIDWRSPNSKNAKANSYKGWQTGNVETDFDNFYNVLTAISGQPGRWTVKMGGLKE